MKHKYLFMEIDNCHEVKGHKVFKTRQEAFSKMSNILLASDKMVRDVVYRDEEHHEHEYVCYDGTRFVINRI